MGQWTMRQTGESDGAGFFQSFSAKKIESTSNPTVKYVAQLGKTARTRRQEGAFVVEGPRMVFETPRHLLKKVYVTEAFLEGQSSGTSPGKGGGRDYLYTLLEQDARQVDMVSDAVMRAMSDTMTPQGILAVVRMPRYELADLLAPPEAGDGAVRPLLLVLETIQDPGNLGTMLRSAEGAGCTGVIMSRDTADIFSPKVVRSTMGSLYRMPFLVREDLRQTVEELRQQGICAYAAHLEAGKSQCYDVPDYTQPTAFCIGNEARGLSDGLADACDAYIHIPMQGRVESLNAAMSAGVLLFEAARQRQRA